MKEEKKVTMFDNWGEFQLNSDFTAKYLYNEKLSVSGKSVVNIPKVARKTRVKNTDIIGHAIANNIAIPRQPKKQEGKVRGKSGEYLFQALISGAIDMNDIEIDHDGWDFEVEYAGCNVEVKTTAPQDGNPGNANLSQGDKPDVYVIFKFNNIGKFRAVYLIPVDVMKARPRGVPKTLKIKENSWTSKFEVSLRELQCFFELAGYYDHVYMPYIGSGFEQKLRQPYSLEPLRCSCNNGTFDMRHLFAYEEWWRIYLRLRASASARQIPVVWCWSHNS